MKNLILASVLLLLSCDNSIELWEAGIPRDSYYSSELVPKKYSDFYGKWKATSMSGGLTGSVLKPDFDFLLIRQFGIYEIIQNEQVVEYGKIELSNFDPKSPLLQVQFLAYSTKTSEYPASWSHKYVELKGVDKLNLVSSCCDGFNHQFERAK
ncbi:MAG TPA: hypothetical protein VGN64_25295 [Dyadobacter sp.]|nr:hypothetical protein [Dyadobacter sp.]